MNEEELLQIIREVDGIVVGTDKITRKIFIQPQKYFNWGLKWLESL
jgi:hypothetical protein